jgi:thioredoxin-dependent peroxiredoxin
MPITLQPGDVAPDFTLPDQTGVERRLSDYRGNWVVIFFYPKDDTPGCTREACNFRDRHDELRRLGATVLGISVDPVRRHQKFIDKYDLPFTLLSDEEKSVVRLYGVWGEKRFMGRLFDGTHRVSFLIDPEGRIARVYPKVKPDTHTDEVIRDLEEERRT